MIGHLVRKERERWSKEGRPTRKRRRGPRRKIKAAPGFSAVYAATLLRIASRLATNPAYREECIRYADWLDKMGR